MQWGSLYHFYDGLWYDPAERRTHDLPCERQTRYQLSQPDTVIYIEQTNTTYFEKLYLYIECGQTTLKNESLKAHF